jgi:hypothetical protein
VGNQLVEVIESGWDFASQTYALARRYTYDAFLLGKDEGVASLNASVFPNPASGMLYVEGIAEGILNASIISSAGVEVFTWDGQAVDIMANGISIEGLLPGVYVLRLASRKKTYTKRFVVAGH